MGTQLDPLPGSAWWQKGALMGSASGMPDLQPGIGVRLRVRLVRWWAFIIFYRWIRTCPDQSGTGDSPRSGLVLERTLAGIGTWSRSRSCQSTGNWIYRYFKRISRIRFTLKRNRWRRLSLPNASWSVIPACLLPYRKKIKKQIALLAEDPRHPSLQTKPIQGAPGIYEAQIDTAYRMTYERGIDDILVLRVVGKHDETIKKP